MAHIPRRPGRDGLKGTARNDVIDGLAGDDVLRGFGGKDRLDGGAGNDVVAGGCGDDTLSGGAGTDLLVGGSGNDTLTGGGGDDALLGGDGYDRAIYSGSVLDYELSALGPLLTVGDRNAADGDDGTDLLLGVEELRFADFTGTVTTKSQGTSGNDLFVGDSGSDTFNGNGGNDVIFGNGGKDTLNGGAGNDLISGGRGNDTLDGGAGDDVFFQRDGDGADTITGGTGVDTFRYVSDANNTNIEITASAASPYISFGADGVVTRITGVEELDITLEGEDEGPDGGTIVISGDFAGTGLAQDTIHIRGNNRDNVIDASGSRSRERVVVDARGGNDTVRGGRGDDTLDGGSGNDTLAGGEGNDSLLGGTGNDTLSGGLGNDSLIGGAGNDRYIVGEGGTDTIGDYVAGDVIDVRAPGFTSFASIIAAAQQVGSNTVITFGAGNTLTLTGVPLASLTPETFGFPPSGDTTASAPTLTVLPAQGNEDSAIALSISAALTDTDGSESLAIRLENVPAGAVLSGGTNQGSGVWLLTPAQLAGLTITPPVDSDADFTLTVVAIATESNGGATAMTSATLNVQVDAVADAGADVVLTNVALGSAILIPEWTLLHNDVPLNPGDLLQIGAVGAASGGTLGAFAPTAASDDVTFTDQAPPNGAFSYTTSDNQVGRVSLTTVAGNTVTGGDGAEVLIGSELADELHGNGGNDVLVGHAGSDHLVGGDGNDVLDGGDGNDGLEGGSGNDDLRGGLGDDTLTGQDGEDLLFGGLGNDTLHGGNDDDRLEGGDGHDTLQGSFGDDVLTGDDGNDVLEGGSGNDFLHGGGGDDVISGQDGEDQVIGQIGNDTLFGGNDNDYLEGWTGDDVLVGGFGTDRLNGGEGADTYRVGPGAAEGYDTYVDNGSLGDTDRIVASADNMQIQLQTPEFMPPGSTFSTATGIEEISADGHTGVSIAGTAGADTLLFQNTMLTGIGTIDALGGDDRVSGARLIANSISGGDGHDEITGGERDDFLAGGDGEDTLFGGLGDDTLHGGNDDDRLEGGDGHDTLQGSFGDDVLTGDDGNDVLEGGSGNDFLHGGGGDDVISGQDGEDQVIGQIGNDTLFGGNDNDYLEGWTGDDVLVGGFGTDRLNGGEGADTYRVGPGAAEGYDTYVDNGSLGDTDRIVASADNMQIQLQTPEFMPPGSTFSTATGIEEISADGHTGVSIAGTAGADTLLFQNTMLTGIGTIDALGGDDRVSGARLIANSISGGDGHDEITGGERDDFLAGGDGEDTLFGGLGDDTLHGGNDDDRLEGGDGHDTLQGSFGDDVLTGDDGNDVLEGGSGNDFLHGGGGDDVISGQDGEDQVIGQIGNDTLFGGNDNDYLEGWTGDDVLVGGFGTDRLNGGEGADTYRVGPGAAEGYDTYVDNGSLGDTDRIVASADNMQIQLQTPEFMPPGSTFSTATGIEEISADGHTGVSIAGTAGADTLLFQNTMLTGIGTIDALGGDDRVSGARLIANSISGGDGHDEITGGERDDFLAGGDGEDTLFGGLGNDTLHGGNDDDRLEGGDGHDTLQGSFGDDVLTGDDGDDVLEGAEGADQLFGDAGADWLSGADGADTLEGGDGNDTLFGGNDDDQLTDGLGNDTLTGGFGTDRFVIESATPGLDTITDFARGGEKILIRVPGFETFAAIQAATTQVGPDTVITFGAGHALTLLNTVAADLTPQDFGLVPRATDDIVLTNVALGAAIVIPEWALLRNDVPTTPGDPLQIASVGDAIGGTLAPFTATPANDDAVTFADAPPANGNFNYNLSDGRIAQAAVTSIAGTSIVGGNAAEILIGSVSSDELNGAGGDDVLLGGEGNDVLIGGLGDDTQDGGAGNDLYQVGPGDGLDHFSDTGASGVDILRVTADDTVLTLRSQPLSTFTAATGIEIIDAAGFFNVTIEGSAGDDWLDFTDTALSGITRISGGEGADTLIGPAGVFMSIDGGDGNDFLVALAASSIHGGAGDDRITTLDGIDTIDGGDGNDRVSSGGGLDAVRGGAGDDEIDAGAGNDELRGDDGADTLLGGAGNDNLGGDTGDDILHGNSGDDRLTGGTGDDQLFGGDGNDILIGGLGDDTQDGGAGNDLYQVGPGDGLDHFSDTGASGVDILRVTADDTVLTLRSQPLSTFTAATGIEIIDAAGFFNVTIEGSAGDDWLDFTDTALSGITRISGGEGADTLIGPAGVFMSIDGGDGNDFLVALAASSIHGGAGDDRITTLDGIDTIDGGDGNDRVSSGGGLDAVRGGAGDDEIDAGAGNDELRGDDGADTLLGGAGNDSLNGGAGVDTAHFAGDLVHYAVVLDGAGGATVTDLRPDLQGDDGVDTLVSIESLAFRDITLHNDGTNNAPIIRSNGGNTTFAVLVPENTVGVTVMQAVDYDPGTTITYSIAGGEDASRFTVDPSNGVLTFATAPDFEAPADVGGDNTYSVIVRASDGALFDSQSILVLVQNDTNEGGDNTASAPTISVDGVANQTGYVRVGNENTTIPLGLQVALTDTDGSETLTVTLNFLPGTEAGATLSDGVHTFVYDGGMNTSVNVSGWNIGAITLTQATNSDADVLLEVTAVATETNGGATATSQTFITQAIVSEGTGVPVFRLMDLTLSGGAFRIDGPLADTNGDGFYDHTDFGSAVAGLGDFDGDGLDDVIVGAPSDSPGGLAFAGASYVVYGAAHQPDEGEIEAFTDGLDVDELDGSNGFRLDGFFGTNVGYSVGGADLSGDGYADILVGTPFIGVNDPQADDGTVYVLQSGGGRNGAATISVGAAHQLAGYFDMAGRSLSSAGDVNGDGFDDVIIGAPLASADSTGATGGAYVIYGGIHGGPAFENPSPFDLSTVDGTTGSLLIGTQPLEFAGSSVRSAGDVNGDGYDDVIIGAQNSPGGAGRAYVVFGAASGFGATLALATLNGTNGFAIDNVPGVASALPTSVSGAGDVNGDGFDDLVVGAAYSDAHGDRQAGNSYVIYGRETFDATLDLAAMTAAEGAVIEGAEADDRSGIAVSGAGDVNGDGFDDLIVADQHGFDATQGTFIRGETYVIFGRAGGFGPALDLTSLGAADGVRLDGGFAIDAVDAAGDVNGDGLDDIVIGSSNIGYGEAASGVAYVVYGGSYGFGDAADRIEIGFEDGAHNLVAASDDFILVGGRGDDTLDSAGWERVVLNGGAGDDLLIFDPATPAKVRGGSGFDTLSVFGDFDLSAHNAAHGYDAITGIEQIDLDNGVGQTLTFDFLDFVHLNDEWVAPVGHSNALLIRGDEDDTVDIGPSWTLLGPQTIGGVEFDVYSHDHSFSEPDTALLYIERDIGNVLI